MQEEIWKDVPGYEGIYQVSDLGNVKSLDRLVGSRSIKGKVLIPSINKGYYRLELNSMSERKMFCIHQLVAMAFLNHKPDGTNKIVVDHLNNIRTDNRLSNLQLISNRENCSKDLKNGTSKYTGVWWSKERKKWISQIAINGKYKYLGIFNSEEEAGKYYQDALKSIEEGTEIKVKKHKYSSKYTGVSWHKQRNKWTTKITVNGKSKHLGSFKCELAAAAAYQKELIKLNK